MISSIDPAKIAVSSSGSVRVDDPATLQLQESPAWMSPMGNTGCANGGCNTSCTNTTDCTGTNNRGCTNVNLCVMPGMGG